MNFSQIIDEWIKEPVNDYFLEGDSQGAFLALLEMTLALIGTVLNLIVLIPIINSSLMNSTLNVLIANLCGANLVSAVFVKLIGVIYHGYAVAASRYKHSYSIFSLGNNYDGFGVDIIYQKYMFSNALQSIYFRTTVDD